MRRRTGRLSFPKGSRKGLESLKENACREFRNETGLQAKRFKLYDPKVLVDATGGCHY